MQLLERESYIAMLSSMLERTADGYARIVLVAGEAGIGKTSLLRQFADMHQDRSHTLWGGCEALFAAHPLAPLHDIAGQISGSFAGRIASATSRHDIFNACLDQFTRLTYPSIVVFEDMHWADEATLDLIKFLGRRLDRMRVLIIVSYRDDEVNDKHPLRAVIGDLPTRSTSRLPLPPLSKTAVGQLAAAAGRASDGLHELTGGNAFFVTEILATQANQVPATVRDAAIARIARLPEPARRVAHLASVIPGKLERWLADAILAPGVEALQECLNVGMVEHPDHSLGFRHELARRAVESSLPLVQRRALNEQVLTTLMRHGEHKVAIARLVHHADQAGDDVMVLRLAPIAAEKAAGLGAHREAAIFLSTALRHGASLPDRERALLLERLSYECYLTDQIPEARAAREEALVLWRAAGDRLKEGDNLRWLSRLAWFGGDKQAAEACAQQAIAVLETLPPGRELAWAYSNRAQLHMLANDAMPTLEWGRKALVLATALGDTEVQTHALNNIGSIKLATNDVSGRHDLEQALQMALAGGFEEHVARAYANITSVPVRRRDYAYVEPYLKAGIDYCEEHDLDSWGRYMVAFRADVSLGLGRWDAAAEDADMIAQCPASAPVIKIPAQAVLGRLRARRGDPAIEAPLIEAYRLAVGTGELQRLGPALTAYAEAAWLHEIDFSGVLPGLIETYRTSLRHLDHWMTDELAYWLWRHGQPVEAIAEPLTPFAMQVAGDWKGAARAWAGIGCTYEEAVSLADSGEEETLRTALVLFERLGAAPMAARVRRTLRAGGVRDVPRGAQQRNRQNPAGMTTRQLKVLTLVAEGRRNADIARLLFVSEKTVDHHVSAILAKLGVRTRGEAAATAARLGLFDPRAQHAKK
ncbi:MAG TPA: AAA family ATPase [Gammaproteobacteria bacterium]|nr:AAA family ATPase [Gammaproteobacteria bacterium]